MSKVFRAFSLNPVYRAVGGRLIPEWVLQGQRPAGVGLEIGAGGGVVAGALLARYPDLRLVVTDHDPAMVDAARRALARFGDRAVVDRADAADLRFDDARFDLVLSCGMLHHVQDWERAITEAARVLRPGGRLLGYDVLDTAVVRRAHRVGRSGRIGLFGSDGLAARLSAAGLVDVRIRPAAGGTVARFAATRPEPA
jgi:SAM-dependent methyltransferase